MKKERDSDCHDASIALKRIEMLMGEFSGFGIIDYYIMYIALYAIEKETLINLLDDISFSRLKENGELLGDEVLFRMFNDNKPTFDMKKALIRFEIEVRRIADLADIFYFSISQ